MCKRSLVLIPFVLMLVLSTNASGQATGTIMREVWEGIGGTSVSDLTGNANYPDNPTWGELVTSFETPTNFDNNFGSRVHGFLHPVTTGDYTFWIATDDNSDLLLSTDADPANAVVIAQTTAWAPERAFDDPDVIPSAPIHLEGGQTYYISGIYKEGGGGDNLAVAWQGPDSPERAVIDGAFLSPAPWAPGLLKAGVPNPADGAIDADVSSLEWAKGATAVSHKVYLSTDATIDDADLLAETELDLQPVVLDPGATYYWRVDEVDADAGVIEGNVWSFSTLPLEAHFPNPADGGTNFLGSELSWTAGKDAIFHIVNFGTDPAALPPVTLPPGQQGTTYDTGPLDADTTYYWRIDEFTPLGTVNGPVWSFSTPGAVTPVEEPGLVLRYPLDEDASSLAALDVAGNGYHGMITGAAWADGQEGGALDMAGVGYVDVPAESWSTIENQMTIALWAYGDPDLMPRNNSVFWADDGAGNRVAQAHLPWGNGSVYFDTGGSGYNRINKGASPDEYEAGWQHWTFLKNAETGDQQIYLDGELWHSGTGMTLPLTGVTAFTIGSAGNHGNIYSGMIDDFRLYNTALPIEEIRTLAGVADLPYGANPADGEVDVEAKEVTLTWNPAIDAVEQDVYLGTDAAVVATADATDTTGIYVGRQAETELALADLGRGVTYFWKVDGVKADGTVMPGTVWNFRIADRNTDNWASAVDADYLNTYVQNGAYDIGTFGGEMTYEFIVNSNPDETAVSMALIGRIGHGDTTAALKYEQYNDTGNYGATIFGVADHDYGVPIARGEYTHLVFVSSEAAGTTELYVNGVLEGSIASAITLSGIVGIGQAIRDPEGAESIDNFDGDIFGVAIYDRLLTADEIVANGDKYFSPIPITDPDMLIYYDFESGEGSMALDQSGHSNHGEFVGTPEWATGLFGGAISIVKEDVDYLQTEAPLGIVSNTVSVTGWVKHDALPEAWSGILTHRGTSPGNVGLQHNGSELRYMWGADLYWSFSSGLPLPVGEWYFAALTISPDQGKLYLDGVEQTATNVAPHEPTNFDTPIYVGGDPANSTNRIMTSLIDEVRFYNRTLTDVEVAMLAGVPYVEGFESSAVGTDLHGVGDWEGWEGAAGAGAPVSDAQAFSGLNSVEIIGTADLVKKLDVTGGQVILTAMQYIPSGTTGDTFFILMNQYAPNPLDWSPQVKFSLGSGQINDGQGTIVYDQWVELKFVIDLDNNTVDEYYNGEVIRSGQWDNDGHNTLQAIDLYSAGASSVYYDDITIDVPQAAPVAHWTFDDGAGTVALDSSGNANDGVLVGDPQWVPGILGGALEFDGDGDYIDCGNDASLDITGDITMMCWIKVAAFTKTWETILGRGDDSYRMSRGPGNGDSIHFGANGTGSNLNATTAVTTDTWRHVALVYDGTNKIIYIDGVEDARLASSGNINSSGYNMVIGHNSQAANRFLTGLIDDVRIYDQALSALQIFRLVNP